MITCVLHYLNTSNLFQMRLKNERLDLWSRQNWSPTDLQPQQASAAPRSMTSALKKSQLCAGRDNRNRSGCRSTPGCMRQEFKGDLLQMEVRNLQGTRQSRAKRDIQQPQLIPGSSDQLHSDLKQGRSKIATCYNFGEKTSNPKAISKLSCPDETTRHFLPT